MRGPKDQRHLSCRRGWHTCCEVDLGSGVVCIIALPGNIQGIAILGWEMPVLDQGIALHCRIQVELLAIHLNCKVNQFLTLSDLSRLSGIAVCKLHLAFGRQDESLGWRLGRLPKPLGCRKHGLMALTAKMGSRVLDAYDNSVFPIQDGKSCYVCGIVRPSSGKLCAYLSTTQTVELKRALATN